MIITPPLNCLKGMEVMNLASGPDKISCPFVKKGKKANNMVIQVNLINNPSIYNGMSVILPLVLRAVK
jgi:hypothetical protein